jgi:hypothetical protein
MGDFVKVLYERFLMRDLLGKVGPGLITAFSIISALGIDLIGLLSAARKTMWLFWLAALPIFFIIGLAVQIVAELLGLHSASPRPRYYLIIFSSWGAWRDVNIDFDRRLALLRNAPSNALSSDAQAQRERFVYLKEGSGNMAAALIVTLVCILVEKAPLSYDGILPVVLFCLALFASHFIHAKRQAIFEIRTLNKIQVSRNTKLLPDPEAGEMLNRIKGGIL